MSMVAITLVALLFQAAPFTPATQDPEASPLDDVVVDGRPAAEAAALFVGSVAAPASDRGLARWRDGVCVGVTNMQPEPALFMADRISDWAAEVGLAPGEPGCHPDIIVIAADDGDRMARELVASRRREFRTGVSGSDRGGAALQAFQNSGRPVRWWHVSLPVDGETGNPARRLPGQPPVEWTGRRLEKLTDFGANSLTTSPTRLGSQVRDDLQQVIIVIDADALELASFSQLTDYVALVALAQIDPDADTRGLQSILNLFDPSVPSEPGLTVADEAFLKGLYAAEQDRAHQNGNLAAVADAMARTSRAPSLVPDR